MQMCSVSVLLSRVGMVYGLGIVPVGDTYDRTLVELDPRTFTLRTVALVSCGALGRSSPLATLTFAPPLLRDAQIPEFGVEDGGIAALDEGRRVLYWVGQRMGAPLNASFALVGVALGSGAVVSEAPLCSSIEDCPSSLEFSGGG